MNIPKSYEALAADLASEKILSKTLLSQKDAYMMLADKGGLDLSESKAREAALRALSVTGIMLDVVPGEDGMGEEIYAKSVADVEALLNKQCEDIEALQDREAALREEIEMAKQVQEATDAIVTMVDGQRDHWIEKCGLLKQRLTVAERRESEAREELLDLSRKLDVFYSRSHGIKNLSAIEDANDKSKALQQRLTVSEQRAADLKKLLCDVINEAPTGFAALKVDIANRVNDALKPDDHPQCEECKGWGYHENHHEGGGTECGECGGAGKATVSVVMPEPYSLAMFQMISGFESVTPEQFDLVWSACREEVSRLNGIKP